MTSRMWQMPLETSSLVNPNLQGAFGGCLRLGHTSNSSARTQRSRVDLGESQRIAANDEASTSGSYVLQESSHHHQAVQEFLPYGSKRRKLLEYARRVWGLRLFDDSSRQQLRQPGLLAFSSAAVLPGGGWTELSHNYIFQAGFWGWFIAQFLKIFTKKYKQGVWDLRAIVESGGMPSSHSALTAAVTTAVALEFGLGSSLFAVALCFTVITMYDAAGVRRHAGKQAEVLNVLLEDVLSGHPVSDRKLKEVLGHTPIQVVSGAILGVVVACFVPSPSQLPVV